MGLLVCLLPLSVSAGELDGKGLVCKGLMADGEVGQFGFRFVDGTVKGNSIKDYQKNIKIVEWGSDSGRLQRYRVTRTKVEWWDRSYRLDREHLMLGYYLSSSAEYSEFSSTYHCEVFSTLEDYFEELERIRARKQKKADEEKSKNKI